MPGDAKRLFPVGEDERRELSQRFCLALRNTQVYGPDHSVSASSVRNFYDSLVNLLDRFPEVEFSLSEGKVLINGQASELRTADDVLARRMQACELETFCFLDSIPRVALNRFMVLLATGKDPKAGEASFDGIRISDSVYARISSDTFDAASEAEKVSNKATEKKQESRSGVTQRSQPAAGVKQFDLDSMLGSADDSASQEKNVVDAFSVTQHVTGFLAQKRLIEEHENQLVNLIRQSGADAEMMEKIRDHFMMAGGDLADWMSLCSDAGGVGTDSDFSDVAQRENRIRQLVDEVDQLRKRCVQGQLDNLTVSDELGKISGTLDGLVQGTRNRAGTLVEKVSADRLKVAELEQKARESGSHLHLSREELLASLAEINQELAQPLTVSSALLELLSSGRLGTIEEKQQELVDVATSSLARLEVVVKYLQRLSGMPIALSPDHALLSEVYSPEEGKQSEVNG